MYFLLLLLRLVLDGLVPGWRDGLTMAARADGRVEHLPTGPTLWDRWLSFTGQSASRSGSGKGKVRAKSRAARRSDLAPAD
jgi:hypothetical protein